MKEKIATHAKCKNLPGTACKTKVTFAGRLRILQLPSMNPKMPWLACIPLKVDAKCLYEEQRTERNTIMKTIFALLAMAVLAGCSNNSSNQSNSTNSVSSTMPSTNAMMDNNSSVGRTNAPAATNNPMPNATTNR